MASEKILVVDDETDLQFVINQKFRRQIRNGQYEFHFAFNGLEALAKLIEVPDISIILSDINMPEMDGLTLLSKVRELKNPLLKTVICSAYGDMENIRTAMNRGAFDFVTKPVDFGDLEVTIEKTIQELDVLREGLAYHDKLLSIEHDLMVAREIQRAILPKHIPDLNWADIYGSMDAAKQIGGDFYDFFLIDDHRLGFVIGDVSGKGIPAAIFMAVSRTLIRATGLKGMSPVECMNYVNHLLCTESVNSMFVTVFYGIIDLESGTLNYVNAGHNPPILLIQMADRFIQKNKIERLAKGADQRNTLLLSERHFSYWRIPFIGNAELFKPSLDFFLRFKSGQRILQLHILPRCQFCKQT